MSFDARFWFAPGVEVMANRAVPRPPPQVIMIAIKAPLEFASSAPASTSPVARHVAEFRLTNWSESGGVAHYDLASEPSRGWRWFVAAGVLRAERAP